MNDLNKTKVERKNSRKRIRRRNRMMSVYVFVVVILVATFGITMSMTFLFNIDKIVLSGESENYTYMQIVEASGIRVGDNLIRLDTKKAEQKILDELLYVETADVNKDFPSILKIHVTRCIPAFNVKYDSGVLLVSRKGKILSDNEYIVDNIPIIYGFEPVDTEPGKQILSKNENKEEAFLQITNRFDHDDGSGISSIDLTDEYKIDVTYRNGVVFKMGNWNDVEYKLDLAANVMNDDSVKGKKGYITMIGSNQCSFRSSGEEDTAETTTQPATDENGKPVTTSPDTVTTAAENDSNTYNPPSETETADTPAQDWSDEYYTPDYGYNNDENYNNWGSDGEYYNNENDGTYGEYDGIYYEQ